MTTWDPISYAKHAEFVPRLGEAALDLLAPKHGEKILDLGCGDGVLTQKIMAIGATVVGIDASQEMVAAARKNGVDAYLQRAEALQITHEFDAVFSNAALHWMQDPDIVIKNVARSLKQGGRFVGEFGGHGNVASIITALLAVCRGRGKTIDRINPWYFPTAEEYQEKLVQQGFWVTDIGLFPRPTQLTTDMMGWLVTFGEAFFSAFSEEEKKAAMQETIALLKHTRCDKAGRWTVDYVRLRFRAELVT